MKQLELEVKILDVDEKKLINKLKKLGAKYIEQYNQYLYTYDVCSIYGRYIDILTLLNNPENELKYDTALERLKLLFFEIDNLLSEEDSKELNKIIGKKTFTEIVCSKDLLSILNKKEVNKFLYKYHNNSKKWIRLRQTNDEVTIAVKHILKDDGSGIQQMLETEMNVPSIQEANELLEALGFSHKSYQEKRRVVYELDNHNIEIDTWPGIPTYFEIEGSSKEDINKVLNKLDYDIKDSVSCTADEIYLMYGIDMYNIKELKF